VSTIVKQMYSGFSTEDCNEMFKVYVDIAARTLRKRELLLLHEIAASLRIEVVEKLWALNGRNLFTMYKRKEA